MRTPRRTCYVMILGLVAALGVSDRGRGEEPPKSPLAVVLPDDADTRGDWTGTYGKYAYVLCGMRSRQSLYGGEGWPVQFATVTGDPKETVRGWRSLAPVTRDRSVLLEPNGLIRTPAAFDDHGEVRPMGKGPDLHIKLAVPEGAYLVSLYFFEIDWIQYRAYKIRVYEQGRMNAVLAETRADNFFKGKYKRFAVLGPAKLHIQIERGNSPNAQTSAVFVDRLIFPDMYLFDMQSGKTPEMSSVRAATPDVTLAEQRSRRQLSVLKKRTGRNEMHMEYLRRERALFAAASGKAKRSPASYYRQFDALWKRAEERLAAARAVIGDAETTARLHLLVYYAARARCNFAGARRALRELARLARVLSAKSKADKPAQVRLLENCAASLMLSKRSEEAGIVLRAYVDLRLGRGDPAEVKTDLLLMGARALKSQTTLPVAEALSRWQDRHGQLAMKERLLLANLYYSAGKSGQAYKFFESVEPDIKTGKQHRWILIAMISSLLRSDRVQEAEQSYGELVHIYEGSADIDEAQYRFGAYYCRKRQLPKAEECFDRLRRTTKSAGYRRLCRQYLERIRHLKEMRGEAKQTVQ